MSTDDAGAIGILGEETLEKLVAASQEAKSFAYCPYSKFHVGASLLCTDDTIYSGCNVENASYGLGICAERTAMVKAISEGKTKFAAIAVACDCEFDFIGPCGACRQFLAEFGVHWIVILTKPDGSYRTMTVGQLLPCSFGRGDLEAAQQAIAARESRTATN